MSVRSVRSHSAFVVDARDVERFTADAGNGPDLRSYWQVLRWRAWLVAAMVGGAVILTGLVLAILPPKYRATTVVLVEPRQPRVTNFEAVIGGIGSDALAIESQIDIIESPALAKRVIGKLNLGQDPDLVSPSLFERFFGADASRTSASDSRQVSAFQSNLMVRRRGLSYIIEISYFSRDPAKAARISNAVAEAYLEELRAARAEVTARASAWLNERIEEMRGRVRESERAVAKYKSEHGLVDVTQGNKLINRQIEDLTQQLALSRTRSAEARARLERVQQLAKSTADPATLAEALQSPVIGALRGQYADVARIEAEYTALYGSRHPSLVAVKAQRADLKRQIDSEIERILAGVRNDYQVASSREASLEAELVRLKAQVEAMSEADVKLSELQRDAQANRSLIEQFLNRAKETKEQMSLQIAEARVISPALTPARPSRPTSLLLIAGGLGGAMLAIAVVLLLEHTRRGFRDPDEVQRTLGLQTVGLLPHATMASPAQSRPMPGLADQSMQRTVDLNQLLGNPGRQYVENLRSIQGRLRLSSAFASGEILAIVSAAEGEGKSQFAYDLARLCAAVGTRTLLVDADLYAAPSDRQLGLQGSGLRQDPVTGLSVMNVPGNQDWHPGHRRQQSFASQLAQYRRQFDIIIVDTPAILSADADMRYLAAADRAVMIVAWEATDRQDVAQAIHALAEHGRKIDGVVLNQVPSRWVSLFTKASETRRDQDIVVIAPVQPAASTAKARAWRL